MKWKEIHEKKTIKTNFCTCELSVHCPREFFDVYYNRIDVDTVVKHRTIVNRDQLEDVWNEYDQYHDDLE